MYYVRKRVVVSYSGGKDSALAMYRAVQLGYEPVCILTTYNSEAGRSWFHGLPTEILEQIAETLDVSLELVKTGSGDNYAADFTAALKRMKEEQGIVGCVFGDIDIEEHFRWCDSCCRNAGVESVFPLWQEDRRALVRETIDLGFKAMIKVVRLSVLGEEFLGRTLSGEVVDAIIRCGADACGENGEYHTFVWDGPLFQRPVEFRTGSVIRTGDYGILPVYDDIIAGKMRDAAEAFVKFRENHQI